MKLTVNDNSPVGLSVSEDDISLRSGDTINIGTSDYEELINKPSINDVELVGDLDSDDLGLADANHTHVKADITDFAHTHTKSDVTDFSHTHVKADVTDFAHSHTKSEITDFPTIPTKTSDLDNDSGFVTADEQVKQLSANAPSYSYWRPLPIGDASSNTEGFTPATRTGSTYTFPTLQAQPSTGTIRMGKASFYNGSYTHKLSPTTLTANRTATLPNKSGTIAFTNDIPPLVNDLGNIDPSEYEDDIEVFLNTLLQDGAYRFIFEDGDDYEYYVVVESMLDNGYVYQKYWCSEEGSKYQYHCTLIVEDDEVIERYEDTYMTLSDASIVFAIKSHTHYDSKNAAMSVFDWCDTSNLTFDNAKPFILYTDTLNSKNWLIERYTTVHSPKYRFIRVYDMSDASHFYIRSGSYSGSTTTWGSWKEYSSGGMKITVNGTSYPITAITKTAVGGVSGVLVDYDDGNSGQLFFADGVGLATVKSAIEGTIPHDTSELTNGAGFLTISDLPIYNGGVS